MDHRARSKREAEVIPTRPIAARLKEASYLGCCDDRDESGIRQSRYDDANERTARRRQVARRPTPAEPLYRSGIKLTLLSLVFYLATAPAAALAYGDGVAAWCTGTCRGGGGTYCTGSATAACQKQFDTCATGMSAFMGAGSDGSGWNVAKCQWTTWQHDGPPNGTVLPSNVFYQCLSGYVRIADGRCVALEEQNRPERPPCRSPAGSNASPTTPYPINLLNGSKLLTATDFETADGRLQVRRSYRSAGVGKSEAYYGNQAGLGQGWRFDFGPRARHPHELRQRAERDRALARRLAL